MATRRVLCCAVLLAGFALLAPDAFAQANQEGMLDAVLDSYRDLGSTWYGNLIGPATTLYGSFVTVRGIFYFFMLGAARRRGHAAVAGQLASKTLWFVICAGIGGVLLVQSENWIPMIWEGMKDAAEITTGRPAVSPSMISVQGLQVTGKMWEQSGASGIMGWTQFLGSWTPWWILVASLITNLSFIGISVQFMITEIAFYIVLGASPLFVATLGVPKLSGVAEGYFRFLIYISVKIFLLYMLVHIAVDIPAAAMKMFPSEPESWGQYFGLVNASGDWVNPMSAEDVMEPVGVTRAALTLVAASLSTLFAITSIPMTLARMISSNISLGISEWWA